MGHGTIMIHNSVGRDVCSILPQLYTITCSDPTAYKSNIGKVRVLKKGSKIHQVRLKNSSNVWWKDTRKLQD